MSVGPGENWWRFPLPVNPPGVIPIFVGTQLGGRFLYFEGFVTIICYLLVGTWKRYVISQFSYMRAFDLH